MPQMPKKILIAYRRQPPIIEYLVRAFAPLGVEVIPLYMDENTWFDKWVIHTVNKQLHNLRILPKSKSLFENHPLAHRNFLNDKLYSLYQAHQPDIVLLIRDSVFGHEALKKISCAKFGWWIESETRISEIVGETPLFDAYFCMNERSVQILQAGGAQHVSYLQHAVDTSTFYAIPNIQKRFDLCFVGTYSDQRLALIEASLEVTKNMVVVGPGWKDKCRFNAQVKSLIQGESVRGEALNRLYNESRVVLNVTGWNAGGGVKNSGMNMRLMEVPATGTCLITDEILELDQFFEIGKDLLVYKDVPDLQHQLRRCLERPDWCEQIGRHGQVTVTQKYTYHQTAETLIRQFQLVKNKA